jgi:hypothetical protein
MALRSALDWHSNEPLLVPGCRLCIMAVEGALRTEEAGGLGDAIIGASKDSIVDSGFPFRNIVICPPNAIG